ncbi:MAG: 4-alpha-glucanotransferase [Proteobacteria bacterium]|nr:4-alpha-glucanotransferase [Pseudomonadota bacterium]MBU1687760.1 4-alpha-glucanotransferase [Pseudomonadota bacterium]
MNTESNLDPNSEGMDRFAGVLLHPSSLPGSGPIGTLGKEAFRFVDFLARSGFGIWQVLPLGPTGETHSPYATFSSTAGNTQLLDGEQLVQDGLIAPHLVKSGNSASRVDFAGATIQSRKYIAAAADALVVDHPLYPDFLAFLGDQAGWLNDFALFMALKEKHAGAHWSEWETPYRTRDAQALKIWVQENQEVVKIQKIGQYLFYRQWLALKAYANARQIRIVGDVPFYVAFDSADVWTHPEYFALDLTTHRPRLMAGVPPDYFSTTGQLWGNPCYDWENIARDNYSWWVERFRRLNEVVDIVRVDHFRGFDEYWAVGEGETTAINGTWLKSPGNSFFKVLERELGHLPIWAEDLGLMSDGVGKLRDDFNFPGMKILQFAFDDQGASNPYLPHNYIHNCVVYSGTHDNDTTCHWASELSKEQIAQINDYLGKPALELPGDFLRMGISSVARFAVFPLQDLLGLGGEGRMNVPGHEEGNWGYRANEDDFDQDLERELGQLLATYGRRVTFKDGR